MVNVQPGFDFSDEIKKREVMLNVAGWRTVSARQSAVRQVLSLVRTSPSESQWVICLPSLPCVSCQWLSLLLLHSLSPFPLLWYFFFIASRYSKNLMHISSCLISRILSLFLFILKCRVHPLFFSYFVRVSFFFFIKLKWFRENCCLSRTWSGCSMKDGIINVTFLLSFENQGTNNPNGVQHLMFTIIRTG